MKKIISVLFILNTITSLTFAQEPQEFWEWEFEMTQFNSLIHEKIYRVSIEDNQQVELIKSKKGVYKGHLNNVIWTTNKNEIRKKRISQIISIPDSIVEKLFRNFEIINFESIPDCEKIDGCKIGFDGETTFFSTETKNVNQTVSFWELTSDYYYTDNIPKEVLIARKIMKFINAEFSLKEQFNIFKNRLPHGRYIYSSVIMMKKGKKVW